VLFVINFFICFLLLQITAKLAKRSIKTYAHIISSAVGGVYSFIILLDTLNYFVLSVSRAISAAVIVLIAFGFKSLKSFAFTYLLFISSSFIVLGVICALAMLTKSEFISVHNSTVYFDISARGIVLSALFAYILSCVIVRLYNRALSKNEIYTLEIENEGKSVSLFAFCDTGNKLREPFSNYPVIVADSDKIRPLMTETKTRVIPASTVNSRSFLMSFKPDRVTVKTKNGQEELQNVYVALSDEVKTDGFCAVFNPEILSV